MKHYNLLTEPETKMLDEFFIEHLENLNTTLNIDTNSLNEGHFYHAIETMFPNWRSEQLANNGNNIAYLQYIKNLEIVNTR